MFNIASRVSAIAIKRALWQNSAPLMPEATSRSLFVNPAQEVGNFAR